MLQPESANVTVITLEDMKTYNFTSTGHAYSNLNYLETYTSPYMFIFPRFDYLYVQILDEYVDSANVKWNLYKMDFNPEEGTSTIEELWTH